jgi:hypothetical protein
MEMGAHGTPRGLQHRPIPRRVFGLGRLLRLFWWDVIEARPGVWQDFGAWMVFEAAGVAIWRATDR